MNHSFDVLVIGGGVIGCSTAYHLARKGAKVMVVERSSIGGYAASMTVGVLAAQAESEGPGPLFDLCCASRSLFPPLVEEITHFSGIDPELELGGIWRVAETEEDKKALWEMKRWQEERGFSLEWLDPGPLKDVHPGLGESLGALWFPADGQIDSGEWVQALAEASRRRGVRFLDQVFPMEFVRDRRRVAGIRFNDEVILCDKMVLAAGAWTSFLLEALRVSMPLEPVKGQLMVLAGIPRAFRGPVYVRGSYLVPRSDGRLVIGSTEERAGFDEQPTLEAQRTLADWASRWCPGLNTLPVVEFQAGLRPGTADGHPILGRVWDYDNLFLAGGHYKRGILLSTYTGRFMADGVLEGRWDPLGGPFSPERFRKKESAG